ncbi:MAG: CPBP family intramembrane metalloprotease [Planctomycetes bacterium]|nr:CPBP family intramembrane metalloprotease [Planctomycetota bacterium]
MSATVETLMAVQIVDTLIVFVWCAGHFRVVGRMLTKAFSPVWLFIPIGLGFLTFAVAAIAVKVCVALFDIPEIWISSEFLAGGYGWGMIILFGCVQPAIVEELAFRGVIQGGLASVLSKRESIIVAACAFAIIHLAFASIPHLFVLGTVAGWLCYRTGSIYPAIVLHFTHNMLCVGMEAVGA